MGNPRTYASVEICAGAGGQALGLEQAGFDHRALVEVDHWACETLRAAFPTALVVEQDVREFLRHVKNDATVYSDLDLLAGGVPCPPFSLAGKQLGANDERDLFPVMLDLVSALRPNAVMIENVRGLLQSKFDPYRAGILAELEVLGYVPMEWAQFEAVDFGVPQLRPRSILVALRPEIAPHYVPPARRPGFAPTVGEALRESMVARGMSAEGADIWAKAANDVAPTLVGGSKKHGGADLGPSRAKKKWAQLGVDAWTVAEDDDGAETVTARGRDEPRVNGPRLTVAQAALLQGFPPDWPFQGRKTTRYRQVGNAFPPPVARAVAEQILKAIKAAENGDQPPPKMVMAPLRQQRSRRTVRRTRAPEIEGQLPLPL